MININIPHYTLNLVKEINVIFCKKQIDNILSTIKLMKNKDKKNEKIKILKTHNIQKCINWCKKEIKSNIINIIKSRIFFETIHRSINQLNNKTYKIIYFLAFYNIYLI